MRTYSVEIDKQDADGRYYGYDPVRKQNVYADEIKNNGHWMKVIPIPDTFLSH